MGVKDFIEQQEAPPTCPHRPYCPSDCVECDGDLLEASNRAGKRILQARGR